MKVVLHRNFEKGYKKLRKSERERFKERRNLFLDDEFHPSLNNHALRGKYGGYRSIDVKGDPRVIYRRVGEDKVIFVDVGTHTQLYE